MSERSRARALARVRLGALSISMLCLSACGDGYPAEWPGIDKPWFGQCADLNGTYVIAEALPDGGYRTGLEGTMLVPDQWRDYGGRPPWDLMTISGDASDALTVTLMRTQGFDAIRQAQRQEREHDKPRVDVKAKFQSPATRWNADNRARSDAEYAKLEPVVQGVESRREFKIEQGQHYQCQSGWLVTDLVHDYSGTGTAGMGDGMFFGRDKKGGLVVHAIFTQDQSLPIWCGDGCKSIPLGEGTAHRWMHWPAGAPRDETAPPAPASARAWAGDYRAESVIELDPNGRAAKRVDEVRAKLISLLPPEVRVDTLQAAGRGLRVRLIAKDDDALARSFAPIEQSRAFGIVNLEAVTHQTPAATEAQVYLQPWPLPPTLSAKDLRTEIARILPYGLVVQSLGTNNGGFSIIVESPDDAKVSALILALHDSPLFVEPELLTIEAQGKVKVATIWFGQREG